MPVRLLAAVLCLVGAGSACLAEELVETGGFSLRYDETVWVREASAPPALLALRCAAPTCPPHAVATFLSDERGLPSPGFGAFGPGAATGAMIDLRIQSLTPGSRIRPRGPVEPIVSGGMTGYRGLYDIEDRALAKTAAAIALLRFDNGTLEIRMKADRLTPADLTLFDRLVDKIELTD
ncbi:hypothetical protein J8I29_05540 [Labrys sp. LIt4]|uniref:hypothetical protein n=1 Tax=Labrys sp. LIt4 TaxID=2821355 RepID=UPI001ADF8898|nr:hypothetical protein [Labrys sp. LIt4]MBP0578763.1 hypothetical protein [Labrys sp. LIt4]